MPKRVNPKPDNAHLCTTPRRPRRDYKTQPAALQHLAANPEPRQRAPVHCAVSVRWRLPPLAGEPPPLLPTQTPALGVSKRLESWERIRDEELSFWAVAFDPYVLFQGRPLWDQC
eukprot:364799-Chlamydomonas_euryale.AAC.4